VSDYNSNGFSAPEDYHPDGTPDYLPFGEALRGANAQLKRLPNPYRGYNFRSWLEVQWAAFWDHLAIEWHYEYQGFTLAPFGYRYRPDFYLPELGYWIEVKPKDPDEKAQRKTYIFNYGLSQSKDPVKSKERAFVLHGGIPWQYPKQGNIIGYSAGLDVEEIQAQRDFCWQMCPLCQQVMIGRINTMSCIGCREELGVLVDDALDCVEGIPAFDKAVDIVPAMVSGAVNTEFFRSGHKAQMLQEAYAAARSTQFDIQRSRRPA
jgi:hypothetical protein